MTRHYEIDRWMLLGALWGGKMTEAEREANSERMVRLLRERKSLEGELRMIRGELACVESEIESLDRKLGEFGQ